MFRLIFVETIGVQASRITPALPNLIESDKFGKSTISKYFKFIMKYGIDGYRASVSKVIERLDFGTTQHGFNETQPVIHAVGYHQLTLLIRYDRNVRNRTIVIDENFPQPDINRLWNGRIFHKKINKLIIEMKR